MSQYQCSSIFFAVNAEKKEKCRKSVSIPTVKNPLTGDLQSERGE